MDEIACHQLLGFALTLNLRRIQNHFRWGIAQGRCGVFCAELTLDAAHARSEGRPRPYQTR